MPESFIMMRSYHDAIMKLPEEGQLPLFKAICRFAFLGEEPRLAGVEDLVFSLIRPSLESNLRNYECAQKHRKGKNQSHGYSNENHNSYPDLERERGKEKGKTIDRDKDRDLDEDLDLDKDLDWDYEKKEQWIKGAGEKEEREEGLLPQKPKPTDFFEEFAGSNEELLGALREFEAFCAEAGRPMNNLKRGEIIAQLKAFPRSEWIPMLEQSVKNKMTYLYRLLNK